MSSAGCWPLELAARTRVIDSSSSRRRRAGRGGGALVRSGGALFDDDGTVVTRADGAIGADGAAFDFTEDGALLASVLSPTSSTSTSSIGGRPLGIVASCSGSNRPACTFGTTGTACGCGALSIRAVGS